MLFLSGPLVYKNNINYNNYNLMLLYFILDIVIAAPKTAGEKDV